MGCCSVKQRDTKKTIRDATPDMVQSEQRGEVTYVGKKPKDIIDESNTDDLMVACKNNNFALVEVLCLKFKILNVCEVRGLPGEYELLRREKYNLMYWNMILVSVAFDHLSALEFFTKKLQCHLRVSLRSPPVLGFSKMQESSPQQSEAFSLLVAINNRSEQCLNYLWNDLRLLWDSYHLLFVIEEAASHKFIEGIKIVMGSQTGQEIFQSMRVQEKLKFLTEILLSRQGKRTLEVKDTIKSELSKHPYATMTIYVLINDTKNGFNVNQSHLETALANMEASEYAKFKYCKAISEFNDQVMKKVNEFSSQEENSAMKKFGENFRHKLEQLDGEIVKLKNGFVNSQEFDDNLTKLFDLTESGDLSNFVKRVQDNDIRVFKRKRLETVKLTPSFAINRYSYFTPLIHAIQHKHLPLVTFMMEKMKIGLRQALCLQFIDNEENFMTQDINEEYQAYSLLAACANRDEQMLRYLWDTHGSHLWTERHFEPVMRYLVESEWCDGIRIMFKSELTVNMIKAFTSEERSFFIENMIGDLFNLEKQNVARTLKEELSQKPYAGLFIVYMINEFENLSDEDFQFWEIATENLYLSELKLLSKTNQSGFSKFILDFMIKRRDDKVKQFALKFIDKLRELPEYEPIILEGSEDAIQLGEEEVKFFKKDIVECKVNYITDIVKFTITGNIKQIQKTIEQEKLTAADIYDLRGLAVKVYDYEQAMMNSREWNPIHYAIYFRQHATLNYFINDLKVNLKIALDQSKTFNEFREDKTFDDMIGDQTHLFGLLLAVWTKDIEMMKTLYHHSYHELQLNDEDLTRVFKMCIQADFAKGFLALLNSEITHYIFVNSTLDAKKELVQYVLSDHCIESKCINSTKNEDQYREVKETLCLWPYACVTWLYLDPVDENNTRYIKIITENFDVKCTQTLANGGQIDDFITKLDRNLQIGIEALSQMKDEEDQKNMEEKQNLTKLQSQKQKDHSDYFKRKIEEFSKQSKMVMKKDLNQVCEDIIKDIFEDTDLDNVEKESRFFNQISKFKLLQYVSNFDDYHFRNKKHQKFFKNIDIEKLNIVHWVLFFDQNLILQKILQKIENIEDQCHIGLAYHGDLVNEFEYEYTEKSDNQSKIFKLKNLGTLVCVLRKSIQCWTTLFEESEHKISLRLSPKEIFDITLFICMENWKEGLNPIVKLIEAAFLKVSLLSRVEFIHKLLRIDTDCYKDIVRIPKILTFVEWMYENYKTKEQMNLNPGIKTLLPSPQENKETELTKITFLARNKPAEVSANIAGGDQYEQNQQQILPNDIIDLNDIKIVEKKSTALQIKPVDRSNDGSPLKNQIGSESEADPAEADSD